MRKTAVLLLLAALPAPAPAAPRDARRTTPAFGCVLAGTIGRRSVEMFLEGTPWKDSGGPVYSLWGYYDEVAPGAVARAPVDAFRVEGRLDARGRFVLEEEREVDGDLRRTGALRGRLVVDARGPKPLVRVDGMRSGRERFALAERAVGAVGYRIAAATTDKADEATLSSYSIAYPRMTGTGPHVAAFNRLVEARIGEEIEGFRRDVLLDEDDPDAESQRSTSEMRIDFDVAFASRSVVSVRFHEYYAPYWYLAWPHRSRWGITFDLEHGREVALGDVLGAEGELACSPTARRLADGRPWADDLEAFGALNEPSSWNLRPGGVSVYYLVDRRQGGFAEIMLPVPDAEARVARAASRPAEPEAPTALVPFGRALAGTIGERRVEMYLEGAPVADAAEPTYALWGYYHDAGVATRAPRDGTRVEGSVEPDGRFTLDQFDPDGERAGQLRGRLVVDAGGDLPVVRVAGISSSNGRNVRFALAEASLASGYAISSRTLRTARLEIDYPHLERTSGAEAFDALVEARVRALAKEFDDEIARWRADHDGIAPAAGLVVRFDVAYASPSVVSLRFHEHLAPGSELWWPVRRRWGVTFDLVREREVTLEEALGAEGVSGLKAALSRVAAAARWARDLVDYGDPAKPDGWNLRPGGVSVYYLGDERNGGFGELALPK